MNVHNKYKHMKLLSYFLLTSLAFILNFCSNQSGGGESRDAVLAKESAPMATEPANYNKTATPEVDVAVYERKLMKNGSIRFETSNLNKTKQLITSAVASLNGYVSNDNISESNNRTENMLTVRVPADKTDSLIAIIESNASKIDYKNIDVQDVTEQFIDLDTRIKTKKEVEARYRELLTRATSVEEILKIEEQIGNIRTEIESAEGRLRYLSNQVQYSTLHVTFYEKYSDFGFWGKMGKAFKNGWNSLLWLLVGIANLWAILLFIAIITMGITFLIRKKKRKV
ncbi:MAG: DUF4349 domain-containing protein [Petrimonas sp.]|jgi:hypothetical protein|nr:MAG: hypothetical protein BWZ00_01636 [Bacteroidetes bacterium ADurb.BinA174]